MLKIIKIILIVPFVILFFLKNIWANEKIKIGLLVPLTGEDSEIGQSIVKSTRLAINKINNPMIEIIPKDTKSDPTKALQSAKELSESGVKIVIGPVFNANLVYLNELKNMTFLSLTNKNKNFSKNIINAGINATSQLKAINKFIKENEIKKTIFLTPDANYKEEIKEAISFSKIKLLKNYYYNTDPTKLTNQIEKITNYKKRKQNLEDEIKRVEKSDLVDKVKQLEKLNKRYTIGNVNFDSVIIIDFGNNLKSVLASLVYTDVDQNKVLFTTINQWFDKSIFYENSIKNLYYP